jgi:thioredoxin-like negative regulator of GroEL
VAKPIVDGLERKLEGKAEVIRLDLMSGVGRQAAAQFRVRGVPTLIVVDGGGQVALTQVGILRPGEVRTRVDELISAGKGN